MPNVILKTIAVCEDCGKELKSDESKMSFEQYQRRYGTSIDKSCVKHNPDYEPEGRTDEIPR